MFFCKKSGPFLNAGCIMYSISVFFNFTFYSFGGVRRHPTHPLLTDLFCATANIKYDFNKRHFIARSLFYYV